MLILLTRATVLIAVALGLIGVPAANAVAGAAPHHGLALAPTVVPTGGPLGLRGGGYRHGRQLSPKLSADEQRMLADHEDGRPADDAVVKRAKAKLRQGEKYTGARNKQKRAGNHRNGGRGANGLGRSGRAAAIGAAAGIGGMAWWLAKLASPACGPAAPLCALAF